MALLQQLGRCLVVAILSAGCADAAQSTAIPSPLRFGAAWYPEQWPKQRWERDLKLMQVAHINVVRVAEFSWSSRRAKGTASQTGSSRGMHLPRGRG